MITGAGGIRDKRVILRPPTLERFCLLKISGTGGHAQFVGPRAVGRLRFRMSSKLRWIPALRAAARERYRANADQILSPPHFAVQVRQRVTGAVAIQTPAPVMTPSKSFFSGTGTFVTKHQIRIRLRERFRSR